MRRALADKPPEGWARVLMALVRNAEEDEARDRNAEGEA
jgi:hypothetical protein